MNIIEKIANAEHVSKYTIVRNGHLVVSEAELEWTNFSGAGTPANPKGGKRTFCLLLSEEYAQKLYEEGWNVKVKEIKDEYVRGEKTANVSWKDYCDVFRGQFDNAMIYTEIVVSDGTTGTSPSAIYKASEYDGDKVLALVPIERWDKLDNSILDGVEVDINPWLHKRDPMNPNAKKGYLTMMTCKSQPIMSAATSGIYADYRIVE